MGCNCKKKIQDIEAYSDGEITEETNKFTQILVKILRIPVQILLAILCGIVIIVMGGPMLIFVMVCIIIGVQPRIKLKKFWENNNG